MTEKYRQADKTQTNKTQTNKQTDRQTDGDKQIFY